MRAAVLKGPMLAEVQEVPRPEPGAGQVRVRLQGCGLGASNLPVWEGRPWFTYPLAPGAPGHEGWGTVDALGAGTGAAGSAAGAGPAGRLREGDRVAFLGGCGFAEFEVVDAADVLPLPAAVPGPFPGEPLACAMNVFERSEVRPGQRVAVVGIGFLGALLVELCKGAGAEVIALGRRPWTLELARSKGASLVFPLADMQAALARVNEETGGGGCERVIEATGAQAALDLAARLTAVRGRLVIAGYHQDGTRTVDMQLWNWRGLDVINAHERDPERYREGMRRAAAAVAAGRLDPSPLYREFPLDDLASAFRAARDRPDGFIKGLVIP